MITPQPPISIENLKRSRIKRRRSNKRSSVKSNKRENLAFKIVRCKKINKCTDKNTPTKLTGAFSSEAIDGNGGSVDEDSECEGMVDMGNIGDDDDDDNDDGDVFLDRPEVLAAKLWMEEKMTSTFEDS